MQWHGDDALAVRASRKLKNDELFVASLGSTILRKHLDDVPLWRGEHVTVRQLVEDFARYLYLPRLAEPEVVVRAAGQARRRTGAARRRDEREHGHGRTGRRQRRR